MCISNYSTEELLLELKNRNLLTNSKSNDLVLNNCTDNVKVILSYGEPNEQLKCRECRESKDSKHFAFYQARVDAKGYLMRSNALCDVCSKISNEQRKKVLDSADIPDKPKSGETCPNCLREWSGNWHRHHVGDDFIAYICGHCNMSFSDQRTGLNLINEKK
jgi:hypothetical protein